MAQEPKKQQSREERLAERQAMIEARKAERANRPEPTAAENRESLVRHKARLEQQIATLQDRLAAVNAQLEV